ncbi:MAG TPA: MarR family transcriptional regulator [Gammaproteobacteria bacterium]|nr:MarR family transcriptional regulator [Gammaproteobacteria bacterium]
MADRVTHLRALPTRPANFAAESTVQEKCQRLAEWLDAWRAFFAVNDAVLTEAKVTAGEFAAMLEIDRSDEPQGPTIGMLAVRLRVRHNTSVGLVTRMSKKGYVRRVRDTRDRRQAHVQLTENGRHALTAMVLAHCRELQETRLQLAPVITI